MAGILRQGEEFLESIGDETYVQEVPVAFGSTIGGHYRHCLEHFEPILESLSGNIDYDARQRDPGVENDRSIALRRTRELRRRADFMPVDSLEIPVRVCYKIAHGATRDPWVSSTLGREAMFAVSHAIHHFALIAVMGRLVGVEPPPGLGMAPSTEAYHRGRTREGEAQ